MQVTVVYARRLVQTQVVVELEPGATVADAIQRSGLLEKYSDELAGSLSLGVWNKIVREDTLLRDADRVEIYRPLMADPKEARRRRAAKKAARK